MERTPVQTILRERALDYRNYKREKRENDTENSINMTSVDWEEVKRLAADFQKAQLSSTLQKYVLFSLYSELT